MKSYEQLLTTILDSVSCENTATFLVESPPKNMDDYRQLESLGLIKIKVYINGSMSVNALPMAKRYFREKRNAALKYWIPIVISNLISLASLVVSIIAILRTMK